MSGHFKGGILSDFRIEEGRSRKGRECLKMFREEPTGMERICGRPLTILPLNVLNSAGELKAIVSGIVS